jgi:hypothetical protein
MAQHDKGRCPLLTGNSFFLLIRDSITYSASQLG